MPFQIRKLKKGELESEFELVELDDVEKRTGAILSRSTITELNSDKLIFGSADLLTTRLRPNLGKTISNEYGRALAGTTEWIPFKLNRSLLHPILLKYYLLSSNYVDNAERLLSGKEHPRVAESDITSLRIPFPALDTQNALVEKILEIENEISSSRTSLSQPRDIINEILCHEFGYPLQEHRERERVRHYSRGLSRFGAGFTLRNSAKFHHPDFELTDRFFTNTPHERIKAYVAVPIRLGATAVKSDFVEEGAALYVHPGATKRQEVIRPEDCHQVTQGFYEKNKRRFGLLPGDVVINRSGEALGKIAFFDSNDPAVCSDFTMRVRFNETMNPHFAWYFMRSVMFQSQIEREQRGTSLPNIFPGQVERMLIVECSRDRQDAIAGTVSAELQRRDAALGAIEAQRKEIEALIEAAIMEELNATAS